MPTLTSMAEDLLAKAKQIDSYLESQNLPSPSYRHDVFEALPAELQKTRASLVNDSNELKNLARGPIGVTMDIAFNVSERPA